MLTTIVSKTPKTSKADILSGLTVALALVPEAVAFAFVAGVQPLVGLYAAFIVGLVTSVVGGRPGMISGATGALAVVMVSLVAIHGVEYLFATVVLMGILQILAGVFKLGKFIRLVPHPVMLGFVNGLAIVIFLAQMGQFKVTGADGTSQWMAGSQLYTMLGLTALTMAVIYVFPKISKVLPAPLMGILVTFGVAVGFGFDARTVGDMASIAGGLPEFHIPMVDLNLDTLRIILPYAVVLALIGLIESLLTLSLIDEITETKGNTARECIGQGTANLVTGFFGGMGGCAMIGQSMINIQSGGRSRLSGIVAALVLLSFILFASPLIEMIPLAALTGVMFMVVIGTFAWSSIKILHRIPRVDAGVVLLVTIVTVFTDLAIAVIVGVIVSALAFAWKNASEIWAEEVKDSKGKKIYLVHGVLFFASTTKFRDLFDVKNDPKDVVIDFKFSRVADHSAIEAIDGLWERYNKEGKKLHLRHLSDDCRHLLKKAGSDVEVLKDDPSYGIAMDYSKYYK
ncbi:MAG: SulP family inorganic anion transporter [Alphaproteobacteria bacterium]